MRRVLAALVLLALATPATAQAPRPPRVHVIHERGPIPAQTLRRAWSARAFRRCQSRSPDDVVHLHVRIDPDASVHIEHGLIDERIASGQRCVVEVITGATFPAETEATHAHVTVYFAPGLRHGAHASRASSSPSAAPSRSYSSIVL